MKVGQAAILVGSLTVEEKGKVVLEIPSVAGDFFSFGGNSVISGDVSGSGYLMLTPGATQVIKLLGNNSHYGGTLAGTVTPAGTVIAPTAAGGTVEILNDKSLGTAPLHFTTTPGGVLRVAKDAPDFTLSNPITTTVAGTIDVPAGVELKLSGSLTAPAALAKAGAGDLRLAGYAQGATIGGINVNTGTLVLDEDSVAGTNAITVATGAALKPAHSGIRHMGALTFAASSKLLGLTEANKDGPLIIAEGALTITAPLIVETAYAPGATWLTTEALQVAEYTTAIAGPIPNNPVRAVNANGDNLSIHAAAAQVSPRYSVLSITPSKDHVFPEAGTGTATTDPVEGQVSSDGAFSASTPLKAADGSAATSASVDTDSEGYKALEAVGLKAEIVDNNRLVVSGDPTDIVDTSVTVLVNGVPQEVKVSVKAYDSPDEITDTETAPDWETTLSTGSDGTTTLFVTYIPSLEDLTGKTVKDIYAYGTGGITITATTVVTASERIASRGASATHFFKVTGTVTDLETAEIARVTYRVGVNRYSQAVGVLLSDTDVKGVYKKSPGSGGGCDAGFGLFGLLAATGAVALLRRKG
ncbi:MAG: hypothetical protein LBF92_00990 [Synergistaceae bacterium]|nr:hypothetical protein [Synergistaceae bacterium]